MSTPVAIMKIRMKPLPRRHRIAHLRALIGLQPVDSARGQQLAALLRTELAVLAGEGRQCLPRQASTIPIHTRTRSFLAEGGGDSGFQSATAASLGTRGKPSVTVNPEPAADVARRMT